MTAHSFIATAVDSLSQTLTLGITVVKASVIMISAGIVVKMRARQWSGVKITTACFNQLLQQVNHSLIFPAGSVKSYSLTNSQYLCAMKMPVALNYALIALLTWQIKLSKLY